jgi:hypothetical protein
VPALQVHELTTQLPRQVWIAMQRGSHAPTIEYPPVRMIQFSGDAYAEGVVGVGFADSIHDPGAQRSPQHF